MSQGPTTSRRRLGAELRRLREEAGMTLEQAGSALECSVSKISRLETGKGLPKQRDVRDLVRLYGKEAEQSLERLLRWARDGARSGWWQEYTPLLTAEPFVFDGVDRYVALESDASTIRCFDMSAFHGLLQQADYARMILDEALPVHSKSEIDRLLEFRMRRQEVLSRNEAPLRVESVIDQCVIDRLMGADSRIARKQLAHVVELAELSNISIQILPYSSGFVRACQGSFLVLEFAESLDQDVVFVENQAGTSYLEGDFGVETFRTIFEGARSKAIGELESRDLLVSALARLG